MIRRLFCLLTGHDMVLSHDAYRYWNGREEHLLSEHCLRCGDVAWEDRWIYVRTFDPEHQD